MVSVSVKKSDKIKTYRHASGTARRFFTKRSLKNSAILGLILGFYMYVKVDGFIKAYATPISREKLAQSLASNVGIKALLGIGHNLNTVSGYMVWNFLCLIAAGGAIWAMIYATKVLRGEEESSRTELFLSGQTTQNRFTVSIIQSFIYGLVLLFIILYLSLLLIGKLPGANFTNSADLFLALVLTLGAAEFLAVGSLASQLMPTRSRALGISAGIFGVFYVIRMIADSSSAHWLLNLSPLGWIEKLNPMSGSDPIWLVPILVLTFGLFGLSAYLATKRDMGEALFADKQTSKAHKSLLGSPFGLAFRMNRATSFAWLVGISFAAFLYSLLAKGAVESLAKSGTLGHGVKKLASVNASHLTIEAFMGIVFLLTMLVVMFYAANSVGRIRRDESSGYLDNFLVRPISRTRWLSGRISLSMLVIVAATLLICAFSWLGLAVEHSAISFHILVTASLNGAVPVVFVLGAGILLLGFIPRLTSSIAYIVVGWSFAVSILSSGININHWILDTSLLHQVVLAPAATIDWSTDAAIVAVSIFIAVVGGLRFNYRDIEGE